MTDASVGVLDQTAPGSKRVDVSEVTVGGVLVERQRMVLADNTNPALFVTVTAAGALKVDNSGVTQPVSIAGTVPVSGTFWQATQPVSAAALPLPTGAATAAKQPALGTAGTPSVDVLTVQGAASGIALPVSIATAPVLVAGSAVIGKVGIDQTTPGTTNLVALAANQSVNLAQVAGVAPAVLADNINTAQSATANKLVVVTRGFVVSPTSGIWDQQREVENATNSTGTGVTAVGNLAQFDDVSPTAITENQFGNLRMSANRNLYGTIRDAAGNERGANITAGNALQGDVTSIAGVAVAAPADTTALTQKGLPVISMGYVHNGTTFDIVRSVQNTFGSSGTGIPSAGIIGHLDDVATVLPAENQYAPVRMDSQRSLRVNTEVQKASFTLIYSGVTIAGDTVVLFGSASKTIRVTRVRLSAFNTTAGLTQPSLIKRSTATSAGTSAAITPTPLDSGGAAVSATAKSWSVAGTPGTPVGTLRSEPLFIAPSGTATQGSLIEYTFGGVTGGSACVLHGVAECLAINTAAGIGTLVVEIDWTEE